MARLRLVGGRPASDRDVSDPGFLDLRLSERATYTALTPTRSTYMTGRGGGGTRSPHGRAATARGTHCLTGRAGRAARRRRATIRVNALRTRARGDEYAIQTSLHVCTYVCVRVYARA